MLFKKKYDLIFGIGEACSCSQILRKCHLQFFSYPYDWLYGSDILKRAQILANNYKDFLEFDDLEDAHFTNNDKHNLCEVYHNKNNGICFNHDFAYEKPLSETFDKVKEKYDRRIKRQLDQIEKSNNILVVYIQTPNNTNPIDDSILEETQKTLQSRFPKQRIMLLYLFCNHENKTITQEKVSDNIFKAYFDYDAYNRDFPYEVNRQILQKLFCKLKITTKFMTPTNLYKRCVYIIKCFFRGLL